MGTFNKFLNYALLTIFLGFIVVVFALGMLDKNTKPDTSKAVPYVISKVTDKKTFNRRRVNVDISIPQFNQNTPEQFAQTAIQAAWDSFEKLEEEIPDNDIKVITVRVLPTTNTVLAKATFAIDKKGWDGNTNLEWNVATLDRKVPPKEYFQTEKLWMVMRKDYQVPDGVGGTMTDEEALRKAIAKKLGIPVDMAHLPIVSMSEYYKK